MDRYGRTYLESKNNLCSDLSHIKDNKFYFSYKLLNGLRISEDMKKKYNFSIDKINTSGTIRYVDLNFLYAVRDNKELRLKIVENTIKDHHSWHYYKPYTEEEVLKYTNELINEVENKEYIILE